jgi:hypothetical protein
VLHVPFVRGCGFAVKLQIVVIIPAKPRPEPDWLVFRTKEVLPVSRYYPLEGETKYFFRTKIRRITEDIARSSHW